MFLFVYGIFYSQFLSALQPKEELKCEEEGQEQKNSGLNKDDGVVTEGQLSLTSALEKITSTVRAQQNEK